MKKRKLWVSILAGALAAIMLLSLVLSLFPTRVSAASSSEIRKQLNKLKAENAGITEQINEVKGLYNANETEIVGLVSQKNAIDQEINLLHQQVENINQQISAYSLLIADRQDELDEAQARLELLKTKHKERIRAMEEEGKLSYWSIVFKANDFSDLLDRLDMIQEINAADKRRLKEISEVAQVVETAQLELAGEKAELETARDELSESEIVLEEKRAEADAILLQLIAKGDEYEAMLDESEALQSKLMNEIAQAEKDLKEAEYKEWLATSRPSGKDTTPSSQAPNSAGWIRPLKSYSITSGFGNRVHPVLGYERFHEGVDMSAYTNSPIYAARSGKVTAASYQDGGAGYYVNINHGDGFSSIYMHMTRYIVKKGDYVKQGQVIGYVGSTGLSTGPHLHFGIAKNGTYVNPMKYI